MNNIFSAQRNSAIFLATLLVLGTIATILPSAQAASYYKDRYYTQGYEPDYSIGQDNNYYKSKDSSVNVNKIKCNNINSNNNGVNVSIGVPSDNDIAEAQAADEGQATTAANDWRDGERNNNKDFTFVCKNDNNNINNIEQINPPPPPPVDEESSLIVNKVVTCQPSTREGNVIQACRDLEGAIQPNNFTIAISGNNPIPSEFEGSNIPVVITLNPGNYQITETADPAVATTITTIEALRNVDISQSIVFSGDCDAVTGEGTLAGGEFNVCTVQNEFTATFLTSGGLTASNTNTDTSAFDINTAGSVVSSFSSQPTMAQEDSHELTATEKITKLKTQ